MPEAVNVCVAPTRMAGFVGEMAMETSAAEVTVNVIAGLTTLPNVAVICEVPVPTPVARP